ncbi:glycosyltransferase family 2 protein [Lacinutrix venerupis]|uniref:Glycosyl transferase family 2 n=1 Tax=Lacinutrix venerupis TaxID=1486034 RepID=A0AAC9LPQ9_9FLAO|nr:glycosyltransferase family 2 protein [Lacinutrix venerupis]APY01520.1 glycosyl transferase family 2 [Lacinutrix venerupis]
MQLSVIILNYNVRYFLELCLQSVEAAIKDFEAEIIVVDNNSHDDSCKMVKANFPNVKLIENKENLGFSKGNNIGVKLAKGEFVCILNPDTVVGENTFKTLLSFAKMQDNVGIVGCKLIDGNGIFLPESKRNVPITKIAIQKALGNDAHYYANHLNENEIGETDVFVGAFMLLKKTVYNEVKGFDEDYFMYGEDIDLSYKIKKAGYKSYYYGKTSVIHYKGESTLKDKTYAKRFYGAMQIFYKKHFKNNWCFDALVFLGIQFAQWFGKTNSTKILNFKNYALVSNNNQEAVIKILSKPVDVVLDISKIKNNTQVIFDANYISYQTIIDEMETSEKNKNLSFKILPKNANFILGSHSSKSRGEVIRF